jgi:hypothetical protein
MFMLLDWQNLKRKKHFSFLRQTCSGNTVVEYSLIAMCVLFFCGIALQSINNNLSTAMADVRDDMKHHTQAAKDAQAADVAAAQGAAANSNGSASDLSAADQALLQESLTDKVQTTGANGATEVLANQIVASAALLLQQGTIDQNQYDILMQLANQGRC